MILEVYTPAQIRTCGKILKRLFEHGKTVEEFLALCEYLTVNASNPLVTKFRLAFKTKERERLNKEDLLNSLGWSTLRSWTRLSKLLKEQQIEEKEIKTYIRKARKAWLELENEGPRKP